MDVTAVDQGSQRNKMKILWLVSWYPNKLSPFEGDFIKRHAEAVSLYDNVQVIYVVRDVKGTVTKSEYIEEFENANFSEKIIYYHISSTNISFFNKIFSVIKYRRLYQHAIRTYIQIHGSPDIVHVHVGMKAGLIAKWMKKILHIPYIITEHWTGFLSEATQRFDDLPVYLRRSWFQLIKEASAITVVSIYLSMQLQKLFGKNIPIRVIPNVVNTNIFSPAKKESREILKFIHVSSLDFQKNPEAILKAFSIVKTHGYFFHLDIFGPVKEELISLNMELGLENNLSFHGEVMQPILAKYLQQADVLILYSRYETFGCVLIEANACGVPVIASNIPAIGEIITDGKNGILIKGEDPQLLADSIIKFISDKKLYDAKNIAKETFEKYGYAKVGKQFADLYREILSAG